MKEVSKVTFHRKDNGFRKLGDFPLYVSYANLTQRSRSFSMAKCLKYARRIIIFHFFDYTYCNALFIKLYLLVRKPPEGSGTELHLMRAKKKGTLA